MQISSKAQRVIQVQQHDQRTEPEALGPLRNAGQEQVLRRRHPERCEVMLRDKQHSGESSDHDFDHKILTSKVTTKAWLVVAKGLIRSTNCMAE
jgi:hypothetical protein